MIPETIGDVVIDHAVNRYEGIARGDRRNRIGAKTYPGALVAPGFFIQLTLN
jgi:hypothetical protein